MSQLPETNQGLVRKLRQQKRTLTRLANSTPYALSGMSVVAPGVTTVDERLVAGTLGGSRVELDGFGLRKYAADGTTVRVDLTGDVAAFSGLITESEIIGGTVGALELTLADTAVAVADAAVAVDGIEVDLSALTLLVEDVDSAVVTAQAAADTGIANAATALARADGKAVTYFQAAAPTGQVAGDVGDLWFDTDDGYKMYSWSGSAWAATPDTRISTALTNAATANTAAGSAQTQANTATTNAATAQAQANTATTDAATADAKAVTATTNAATASTAAATADAKAVVASGLASTKAVVLYQTAAPGSTYQNVNTLWIDTTGGANTPKKWVSGTTWAAITDKAATDAASAAATANTAAGTAQAQANTATTNAATADAKAVTATTNAATAQTAAGAAQITANSKITTFYQIAAPTATAIGDLWVDTDDGNKLYRATAVGAANWVTVQDTTIATAQAAAVAAQASANGKNTITWSTADPSGSGIAVGDVWFKRSGTIIIGQWEWSGTAWTARTIDNVVIANLDAGKITTGYLLAARIAADTITGAMIVANAITASEINAGAVGALELAANSVIAGKIAAGTIVAADIAANAVTAVKIAAGAITAEHISAAGITADVIVGGTITGVAISGVTIDSDTGITFGPWPTDGANLYWDAVAGRPVITAPDPTGYAGDGLQVIGRLLASRLYVSLSSTFHGAATFDVGATLNGSTSIDDLNVGSGGATIAMTTTTSAANVYSGGNYSRLSRVSSLSRFKLDQRRVPVDYSILELLPLTWRDLAMVDADPATRVRVAGFVAEHVAALSAARGGIFDPLLTRDEDGNLQGLAYDRIVAYVLPVVADMNARMEAIEARRPLARIRRAWARLTRTRRLRRHAADH